MMKLNTKSMFGDQALSSRSSAPKFSFGAASRDQAGKVFLSKEHAKLATDQIASPGPSAYTLQAAVGRQHDGAKASAPNWVFGTADRFMGNTKPSQQNPGKLSATPHRRSRRGAAPLRCPSPASRRVVPFRSRATPSLLQALGRTT